MLVYMFLMSDEHILMFSLISVLFNAFIRRLVLFTLNELGSCIDSIMSCVRCYI
jgi:hypothetical protein